MYTRVRVENSEKPENVKIKELCDFITVLYLPDQNIYFTYLLRY